MQIDIRKAVIDFVVKHGADKASVLTGCAMSTVVEWGKSKFPKPAHLNILINHDPGIFGYFVPSETNPEEKLVAPYEFPQGTRVAILMPSIRPIHIGVLKAVTALYEKDKMQFFTIADNSYVRSRNWCAQRFLDSKCEYSFWLDDDTIPPFGDVPYFRKLADNQSFPAGFININPIARLIQTGRSLVGGCYFGRQPGGIAQFKEAYLSNIVNDAAHAGPRNVVDAVGWVGFGCTLVHRKVFEDIINTQDVLVKNAEFARRFEYNYKFFNYIDDEASEDVSFCNRAKQAGHQAYVDMSVMPLHMGSIGFSYHNTRKAAAPIL